LVFPQSVTYERTKIYRLTVFSRRLWFGLFRTVDCRNDRFAGAVTARRYTAVLGSGNGRVARGHRPMARVMDLGETLMSRVTLSRAELEAMSPDALDALERQIAGRYMHRIPWGAVAWGLGNLALWLALWPLVLFDYLSIWLAFPIATLSISLSYLPSHEAQHNIIAREGHRLRWLNELVGHLSPIPLAQPYRVLRATHMEHHAHSNHPDLDPDYPVHAPNDWAFLKNSLLRRQPGGSSQKSYGEALERTGNSALMIDALVMNTLFVGVLFSMAWTGHAIEAALLWWLPRHIALTYIQYYLSWAPHHPGIRQERYGQTRAFKSQLGNLLSMGMQYHIVHHLYPRIPLSSTPAAFRDLKDILALKGCDIGGWEITEAKKDGGK